MSYYNILGISKNANTDEVKKAFRVLATQKHPDKGGNEEEFKKIKVAYDTLSNVDKRKHYDNIQCKAKYFSMSAKLEVSLEDICCREIKHIQLQVPKFCECDNIEICNECQGSGMVRGNMLFLSIPMKCPKCQNGILYRGCEKCSFDGVIKKTEDVQVHLTPDMGEGFKYFVRDVICVKGYSPGDLIVSITIKNHDVYQVDGKHLKMTKNITLKEALIGFEMNVKHPSGKVLNRKIENVKDTEIVFENEGITTEGNLYVKFNIEFPTLTEMQKNHINLLL